MAAGVSSQGSAFNFGSQRSTFFFGNVSWSVQLPSSVIGGVSPAAVLFSGVLRSKVVVGDVSSVDSLLNSERGRSALFWTSKTAYL